MTGAQIANQIRGWVDYIAGWVLWLCWVGLVVIAAGTVMQQTGARIPMVTLKLPQMAPLNLAYLAGVLWLLKR